jgi:hypothetical protein
MTETDSIEIRPETPEEASLRVWFEEQEKASISNLEAAARQIIQLVTAFYGVVFGVVSLGADSIGVSLRSPLAVSLSAVSIFSLLGALITALLVVIPWAYTYRLTSLTDKKAVYQQIIARKSSNLRLAALAFGLGIFAFAWLIFDVLFNRLG